jgi:CubicO group peptidase (beta-lactamase class C family)
MLLSCGGSGSDSPQSDPPPTTRFFPGNATVPVSGPEVSGAATFDQIMTDILRSNDVPGATLAIARNGRLIFARGYGYADFEGRQAMAPDSMFRIGSVSKVLTSMAVLHLKDQGLLRLDDKLLDILTDYQVPAGGDARLHDITLRDLLHHAGGWDRNASAEPTAGEISKSLPVTTDDTIRYYMTRRLDFTPGTKYAYSNVGFCMLGPVVEKITGQRYEIYVRDNVLQPMGVHAMSIGLSGPSGRGAYEVKYYEYAGKPLVDSSLPGQGKTSAPYGADLANCPSSGSWIGSAIDLTRVMTAIEGSRGPTYLSADTMVEYLADPKLPPFVPNEWWGLGIAVGTTPDAWSHGGLVPGSEALLQRTSQYVFAVLLNSWPPDADQFGVQIHTAITNALNAGLEGSSSDLYVQFPSRSLPASSP